MPGVSLLLLAFRLATFDYASYLNLAAVGISNFIYQLPSFLSISIFPIMFSAIGMGYSTLVVAIASFAGIIITLAVFNEIFGYRNDATYDSECVQS